jgi:membrane associated rhomboid family serine protease
VIPVRTTAPRLRTPVLVLALVAANAAVFLHQQALPPREAYVFALTRGLVPRRYADPGWALAVGLDPGDWTPLVTSAFLHGGWIHLIANMWTLWLFGGAVESRLGRPRFAALYGGGLLAAAAAQMWAYPASPVPVIGASGAVAAVLGAHVVLFPASRVLLLIPILFIPLFVPVGTLVYAGIWFAIQVLNGAGALASDAPGGVAWWAHVGGFLGGLAIGRLAGRPQPPGPPAGPPSGPWGPRA